MIDYLRGIARSKAINDRTGWARWYDIQIAYYPRSDRYSYFLATRGVVNKRDLEAHITKLMER